MSDGQKVQVAQDLVEVELCRGETFEMVEEINMLVQGDVDVYIGSSRIKRIRAFAGEPASWCCFGEEVFLQVRSVQDFSNARCKCTSVVVTVLHVSWQYFLFASVGIMESAPQPPQRR